MKSALKSLKPAQPLKCALCATGFFRPEGRKGPAKFCSQKCREVGYKRSPVAVPCLTCGAEFLPARYGREQKFCSLDCRRYPEAKKWPTAKERACAQTDRRRAQKFGAGYEQFWRRAIYERDGWLCQICKLPVDRSESPDPHLRPALDHIVPLAKGGQHNRANVQCSHWICNSRKAHRMDGGRRAAEMMKEDHATGRREAGSGTAQEGV